jgi:hypothetical protein
LNRPLRLGGDLALGQAIGRAIQRGFHLPDLGAQLADAGRRLLLIVHRLVSQFWRAGIVACQPVLTLKLDQREVVVGKFLRQRSPGLYQRCLGLVAARHLCRAVEGEQVIAQMHALAALNPHVGDPARLWRGDEGIVALAITEPGIIRLLAAGAKQQQQGQGQPFHVAAPVERPRNSVSMWVSISP